MVFFFDSFYKTPAEFVRRAKRYVIRYNTTQRNSSFPARTYIRYYVRTYGVVANLFLIRFSIIIDRTISSVCLKFPSYELQRYWKEKYS